MASAKCTVQRKIIEARPTELKRRLMARIVQRTRYVVVDRIEVRWRSSRSRPEARLSGFLFWKGPTKSLITRDLGVLSTVRGRSDLQTLRVWQPSSIYQ